GQLGRKGVVVIEAAVETRRQRFVKNDRAYERRRLVTVFFQDLSQSARLGRKRSAKVQDSMRAGQQTRHDAGVRSVGDRTWREGIRETNTIPRQAVQRWSSDFAISITSHVVRSKRIDGDEIDVGGLSEGRSRGGVGPPFHPAPTLLFGRRWSNREQNTQQCQSSAVHACQFNMRV